MPMGAGPVQASFRRGLDGSFSFPTPSPASFSVFCISQLSLRNEQPQISAAMKYRTCLWTWVGLTWGLLQAGSRLVASPPSTSGVQTPVCTRWTHFGSKLKGQSCSEDALLLSVVEGQECLLNIPPARSHAQHQGGTDTRPRVRDRKKRCDDQGLTQPPHLSFPRVSPPPPPLPSHVLFPRNPVRSPLRPKGNVSPAWRGRLSILFK